MEIRQNYTITNKNLIQRIDEAIQDKILDIDDIIDMSLQITAKQLHFVKTEASNNPNINFETTKANCVGYAALCASIGNHILNEKELATTYQFRHVVGKLKFLGYDVHSWFQSPFFKDHDYNEIINTKTGKTFAIDASVYDYTWIKRVNAE